MRILFFLEPARYFGNAYRTLETELKDPTKMIETTSAAAVAEDLGAPVLISNSCHFCSYALPRPN